MGQVCFFVFSAGSVRPTVGSTLAVNKVYFWQEIPRGYPVGNKTKSCTTTRKFEI